jgi:hypothetical protein
LDSQVFDELYGVLSVDTGFFGLTSATNYIPETNYIPICTDGPSLQGAKDVIGILLNWDPCSRGIHAVFDAAKHVSGA